MYPFVEIANLKIHLGTSLMLLSFIVATFYLLKTQASANSKFKLSVLAIVTSISAFLGARIFHVLFEKPEILLSNPSQVFTRFDGMTFYGAFIAGTIVALSIAKFLKLNKQNSLFDTLAISTAFTYGLMRVGCFLSGCCWGIIPKSKLAVKFSVVYFHSHSVMPIKGVPVHATQLYDALAGFIICSILLYTKTKLKAGQSFNLFLVLYPIARFITEEFRGDSFRGENIILGLSTSQVISVIILSIGLFMLLKNSKYNFNFLSILRVTNFAKPIILAFMLTSCILPKKPGYQTFKHQDFDYPQGISVHTVNNKRKHPKYPHGITKSTKRNLLFVALDDTVQGQYQGFLQSAYKTDKTIRLEEVSWWKFSKHFKFVYNKVYKISYKSFTKESLKLAFELIEEEELPYDVILLTHGIPNHLTASKGKGFISYKDIQDLESVTTKMKNVFLQACFGNTLIKDFHNLGADTVISFDGLNRNFFFIDYYLKNYKNTNYDAIESYHQTMKTIESKMPKSKLYNEIIKSMNVTWQEYFEVAHPPEISFIEK